MTTELVLSAEATEFKSFLTQGRDLALMVRQARENNDEVSEAIAFSQGMQTLQSVVKSNPAVMQMIQAHSGNRWGFATDVTYQPTQLVPVFCEAVLNGLRAVGNEFNVLEGSLYVTKEGWRNRLQRLPGVTEADCCVGAVSDASAREFQTKKGYTAYKLTALIPASASCKVWGQPVSVEARLRAESDERVQVTAIAEHEDLVIDQLRGKAEARMWERLYLKAVSVSKAGPQQAQPVVVPVAAITHGDTLAKIEKAWSAAVHGETPETYEDTPLGRMRSRLKDQPAKVALLLEAWEAFSLSNSVDELEMLRNELKTKGWAVNLTVGDAKEVMALFESRKKDLQT